jgi:predicted Zn-dependent protease
MLWLFKRFETLNTAQPPNFLSDHPTDEARIAALQQEFRNDPATFGRFSSNMASATPVGRSPRVTTASTTTYQTVTKKPKGMFPPGSGYKF